jgi:hypothetical protein
MKVAKRLTRTARLNLKSDSFTLSKAKTYLGRLMDKASRGETVYIVRGEYRFVLQRVQPIDPIPMRPLGYFANCYSKAEMQEENRLAKASVVRLPIHRP